MKKINNIVLEDDDYYYSPEGYLIFTEKYLLEMPWKVNDSNEHSIKPTEIKRKGFLFRSIEHISIVWEFGSCLWYELQF